MKKIYIIIGAIIVAATLYLALSPKNSPESTDIYKDSTDYANPESTPLNTNGPTSGKQMEDGTVSVSINEEPVVTYTDNGFSPGVLTVAIGTKVKFINESNGGMWVASAPHPTHTALPGFDEKMAVQKGGTYEYTFTKEGTWKYHNHVSANHYGSIIVK
ncbi:MAG: hypothetical protein WC795_01250 [Candidatus Paceibacterota bacterium]|jgi:plastocyanin